MHSEFISTAIPYVNAPPHIGFALELIIADVIARFERRRGREVLFQTGTDDHSLKNVLAAQAQAMSVRDFVDQHGARFSALNTDLNISNDSFFRTSADPRHPQAVSALWRACADAGDIYRADYEGLYCVGCEQFYQPAELVEGRCPEHAVAPKRVCENNYFFRLSRYQDELIQLIESDRLRLTPESRKREILAFLSQPLRDLSISRSSERARNWGLSVDGDSSQVVYVWFDALANYISGAGYATDARAFERQWTDATRIRHVIGKGVSRFHAVYWPAILLSAGLRLPDEILVHGYITIDGEKISKSIGNVISPDRAIEYLGLDALRYFLLRHIGGHGDGDFSWDRLRQAYVSELANDLGNLVSRTTGMGKKYGVPDFARDGSQLSVGLSEQVAAHIDCYELSHALKAIWKVVDACNRYINAEQPWKLARAGEAHRLEAVLSELYATLYRIGYELEPFVPQTAVRIHAALAGGTDVDQLFDRERLESVADPMPA